LPVAHGAGARDPGHRPGPRRRRLAEDAPPHPPQAGSAPVLAATWAVTVVAASAPLRPRPSPPPALGTHPTPPAPAAPAVATAAPRAARPGAGVRGAAGRRMG